MTNLISLYEAKDRDYFSTPRHQLIELIDRDGLKVLDVGCASGLVGKTLLDSGRAKWVTGIEMVPEQGSIAKSFLNEVCIGNVEEMTFHWAPQSFDCFVFGDVLEHVANPWRLLRKLRPFLAKDGIAVASIPNVRHWPLITGLVLRGEWRYTESGVLDITHLRFFTRKTAIAMFRESGYAIQLVRPSFSGRRYSITNSFTLGIFAGFLSVGWLIRLKAD